MAWAAKLIGIASSEPDYERQWSKGLLVPRWTGDRRRAIVLSMGERPRCPLLTVDAVILDPGRGVLLIRRGHPPFEGCWAMPGGFVEIGESCEAACCREVEEETGLEVEVIRLLDVLSEPGRDPRGHVVSVVYLCRVLGGRLDAGDDAADARWFSDLGGVPMAFDHEEFLGNVDLVQDLLPAPM